MERKMGHFGLADLYAERRYRRHPHFLDAVEQVLDWSRIERKLKKKLRRSDENCGSQVLPSKEGTKSPIGYHNSSSNNDQKTVFYKIDFCATVSAWANLAFPSNPPKTCPCPLIWAYRAMWGKGKA